MNDDSQRSFFGDLPTTTKLLLLVSVALLPLGIVALLASFGERAWTNQATLAFLPLLMWASAAAVTLFVVDRMLLSPLRALQRMIREHQPGERFRIAGPFRSSREIRALGDAIAGYIDELDAKDASLAAALDDQRRATREVHHRVKNNIQVVASLINLHARAAKNPEAATAYAAIQRRVDAMAIVHRNHYAESSETQGLDVKALLGEVATNLRASFAPPSPQIALAATPVRASQDHALAIAFLATELAELATMVDPEAAIRFEIGKRDALGYFNVESPAFTASAALSHQLDDRYGRVIDGLSRQLRATLDRGEESFAVTFAAIEPAIGSS